jgi:hypothetical protein
MAFTFDPTTNRGKVRLLVSDTDDQTAANQVFTDAEIDAFLSLEDNEVYAAAAAAAQSMAANASRSAIKYIAQKILELDLKDVPKHFRELAEEYRERSIAGPGEEIDAANYRVGTFGGDGTEYLGDPER